LHNVKKHNIDKVKHDELYLNWNSIIPPEEKWWNPNAWQYILSAGKQQSVEI
jgi:hypothetical protein